MVVFTADMDLKASMDYAPFHSVKYASAGRRVNFCGLGEAKSALAEGINLQPVTCNVFIVTKVN